jgi:HD domain
MMSAFNVSQNSTMKECSGSNSSNLNGIGDPRRSLDFENADNNNDNKDENVAPNPSSNGVGTKQEEATEHQKNQQQQPRPRQPRQKQKQAFRLRSLTTNATGDSSAFRFLRTNDEIHQSIDLCPVLQTFLDTPQMQRLRHVSQLGTSALVFINANHNRFEHSLGVAHLAERMCKRIMDRQPALRCTKKDVLCIKLAGLLHDIGHGPFSHVYEDFITSALPRHLHKQQQQQQQNPNKNDDENDNSFYNSLPPIPHDWKHECVSLMMIDAALEYLGLQIDLSRLDEPLRQIGHGIDARAMRVFDIATDNVDEGDDDENILTSRDFVFIKECIWGQPLPEVREYFLRENSASSAATSEESTSEAAFSIGFVGRPMEKEWLYDIVSNRHSGLDVDKVSAALFACHVLSVIFSMQCLSYIVRVLVLVSERLIISRETNDERLEEREKSTRS